MKTRIHQEGFSLVELTVVILIMGLLLGSLMMPLSAQRENARVREAREQLDTVRAALEGFALLNGFLPCPATPSSNGSAANVSGGCSAQHGFVPSTTLNLNGQRNADNLLLDPWGSPLRYSVSASDANGDGTWDFVTAGQMRAVTITGLQPDLVVCSSEAGASGTGCGSPGTTLTDGVPMVLHSLGKDWSGFTSAAQLENVGATIGAGPAYPVNADNVFVTRPFSDAPGNEFDDLVAWLPPNVLYGRLVAAGHLVVAAPANNGSGGGSGSGNNGNGGGNGNGNNGNGNGNGGGNGNGNNGNGNGNGGGNGNGNNGNGNGNGGGNGNGNNGNGNGNGGT